MVLTGDEATLGDGAFHGGTCLQRNKETNGVCTLRVSAYIIM